MVYWINSHEYGEEQKISLNDLSENNKENLSNLSDEDLQSLKQQAVEEENYDVAKLIKQEQDARKQNASQGKYKAIKEEQQQSHKENLKKAEDLKSQLKEEGDNKTPDEKPSLNDWKDGNPEVSDTESPLSDLSDEEFIRSRRVLFEIKKWSLRNNAIALSKLREPGSLQDWWRETMPFKDKQSCYKFVVNEIYKYIDDSRRANFGTITWNSNEVEFIIGWLKYIEDLMKWANMEDTDEYWRLKSEIQYFNNEVGAINSHLGHRFPWSFRRSI